MIKGYDHFQAADVVLRTDDGESCSVGDDVLSVTLSGATRCVTQGVFQLLESSLDIAQREGRALILSHEGSDFSAGEDWPLLYGLSREGRYEDLEQYLGQCYRLLEDIRESEVPFVLMVEGKCLGVASRFLHLADSCIFGSQFVLGFEGTVFGLPPVMGSLVDFRFQDQEQTGAQLRQATLIKFEKILFAKLFDVKKELSSCVNHGLANIRLSWSSEVENRKNLALQEAQNLIHSILPKLKPSDQVWVGGTKGWSTLAHQIYLWESMGLLDRCRRDFALEMAGLVSGLGVSAERNMPRSLLLEAEKDLFMKQIRDPEVLGRLGQALGVH